MIELHCEQLKRDIDSFAASMKLEADRKGGQKTKDAIVNLIRENPRISSAAIASALGINRSAVSKHMKQMQDSMLIRRVGPDKGGHWEVCN